MRSIILILLLLISSSTQYNPFPKPRRGQSKFHLPTRDEVSQFTAKSALIAGLALAPVTLPPPVHAAPYLSKPVAAVVAQMGSDSTSKEYMEDFETIGRMITEGEGIGGDVTAPTLTSTGIDTSGEDTIVYNPGLTLLSTDEKEAIVEKLHDVRALKESDAKADQAATYLIGLLDPLHTYELKGFLGRLPLTTAAAYIGATAVLIFAKDVFPFAYVGIVAAAFVVPALIDIITKG
ncbi:hypothetical protein TrVE_jg5368 [Triparma verrucosa]|uniref:Uncharacterized protein n=1 Tax=Triparma verrucosa TaxID=1606542 RepID=A0A9W7EI29_9STRA|nr:hypothetical protein TrVE_jg5368 [Triparma verrucosa]